MRVEDVRAGFEDMKAILKMESELEHEGVADEDDRQALKGKLEYIKSRMTRIAMENDRLLRFVADNVR